MSKISKIIKHISEHKRKYLLGAGIGMMFLGQHIRSKNMDNFEALIYCTAFFSKTEKLNTNYIGRLIHDVSTGSRMESEVYTVAMILMAVSTIV